MAVGRRKSEEVGRQDGEGLGLRSGGWASTVLFVSIHGAGGPAHG